MLIIVAIAVLAFVAVMILLAVAAVSEYGQWQRIRFDASAQPFMLSLNEAFDPDHALLWSTQIPALRTIHQAGSRGVKYAELLRTYQQAMRTFPELYEGSSFPVAALPAPVGVDRADHLSGEAHRVRARLAGVLSRGSIDAGFGLNSRISL